MVDRIDRILAEIDELSPKELADGLRLAVKAFAIKANRVTGRDRQWMSARATLTASALLEISTGGVPL